jgi:hypothetical protein
LLTLKELANSFGVASWLEYQPRVGNPGLKFANAFGVETQSIANAFGVETQSIANALGVSLPIANAFGLETHSIEKYFASGWWTIIADVDCSGSS